MATLIGGVAAACTFLPRVAVQSVDTEDAPRISYYFTVSNNNFVPLEDLNVAIGLCRIRTVFKDFKGQDEPITIAGNENGDRCDYSKAIFLTTAQWLKHHLSADESFTFNISDYFNSIKLPLKVADGEMVIALSFKPWIWPFAQQKYFRFVADRQPSGHARWVARPLDQPNLITFNFAAPQS